MGNCISSQDDVKNANRVTVSLEIKHFTWSRDSHGLFDYENKNVVKGQIRTNASKMIIIRQKEAIRIIQTKDELLQYQNQPDVQELLRIQRQISKYYVEHASRQSKTEEMEGLSDNCSWIVVKSVKSQLGDCSGYDLKEGDYIKLGRVRFRIREIKCDAVQNNEQIQPELQKFVSEKCLNTMNLRTQEDELNSQGDEPQCRICYNESVTHINNPLIDCCKCQGSVKYIHLQCLQTWLANKLQPKTTKFSVSFQWKQFECEVCKALIPSRVQYQDKIFETVVIPKPEPPYITLEILSKDRNQSKGTHIISFAQKQQIKLGRGHDSDVRITDISVSRCHAIIRFVNCTQQSNLKAGFVIEDQQSKFGTLILMNSPVQIDVTKNLALQIGRSVLSFQASREWNVQSCCMQEYIISRKPITDDQLQQEDLDLIGKAIGDEDQFDIFQHEEEEEHSN